MSLDVFGLLLRWKRWLWHHWFGGQMYNMHGGFNTHKAVKQPLLSCLIHHPPIWLPLASWNTCIKAFKTPFSIKKKVLVEVTVGRGWLWAEPLLCILSWYVWLPFGFQVKLHYWLAQLSVFSQGCVSSVCTAYFLSYTCQLYRQSHTFLHTLIHTHPQNQRP